MNNILEEIGIGIIVLAVVGLSIFGFCYFEYGTAQTVTFTVKKTAAVPSNNSYLYLIYIDKGVFEDADSLGYMKFNSSDVFNQINEGDTYTAKVYGWRIPVLSAYKNIVWVRQLP